MSSRWATERRLARLRSRSGSYIWLAFDHGLTFGAEREIADISARVKILDNPRISGIVVNRGIIRRLPPDVSGGVVLQTFGFPRNGVGAQAKVQIATAAEAVRLGVDAIAIELNLNSERLEQTVGDASLLVGAANAENMPVLTMATPSAIDDPSAALADAIRVSTEIGADVIKVGLEDRILAGERDESFEHLRTVIRNSPPVILAGGPRETDIVRKISLARDLRFQGVCIGRHLFDDRASDALLEAVGLDPSEGFDPRSSVSA